jgi:hypothetical protein
VIVSQSPGTSERRSLGDYAGLEAVFLQIYAEIARALQ